MRATYSFPAALELLRKEWRVRRCSWPEDTGVTLKYYHSDGEPYFLRYSTDSFVLWTPTAADILADDWEVVQ